MKTAAVRPSASPLSESIASYDAFPEVYSKRYASIDTSRFLDWVTDSAAEGAAALDVGCGSGRDAAAMSMRGLQVTGVDLSRAMVERTRSHEPATRVVHGNMLALPFQPESFDVVWSMASLVHLDDGEIRSALMEMRRVLKRAGSAFVSVPKGGTPEWRSDGLGGRRWFNALSSIDELANACANAGLEIVRVEDADGIVRGRWINALLRPRSVAVSGRDWAHRLIER